MTKPISSNWALYKSNWGTWSSTGKLDRYLGLTRKTPRREKDIAGVKTSGGASSREPRTTRKPAPSPSPAVTAVRKYHLRARPKPASKQPWGQVGLPIDGVDGMDMHYTRPSGVYLWFTGRNGKACGDRWRRRGDLFRAELFICDEILILSFVLFPLWNMVCIMIVQSVRFTRRGWTWVHPCLTIYVYVSYEYIIPRVTAKIALEQIVRWWLCTLIGKLFKHIFNVSDNSKGFRYNDLLIVLSTTTVVYSFTEYEFRIDSCCKPWQWGNRTHIKYKKTDVTQGTRFKNTVTQ